MQEDFRKFLALALSANELEQRDNNYVYTRNIMELAETITIIVSWDQTLRRLVESFQCFRGTCCLPTIEAPIYSETMVTFYHTTRCQVKEIGNL
jgi:hypothetical protein